jgi:hypothetical protein
MSLKIPKNTPAEPDVECISSTRWQFILSAIIWWKRADKKKLDRCKAIGSIVAVVDGIVIFYAPRWRKFNYKVAGNRFLLMPSIVINCAGDNELARKINDYLMDKITQSRNTIYISLSEDEVEIVLEKLGVSRDQIRKILHDFIKSDPDIADHYSITEFEDVFILGIPKSLDEMIVNCEMCGYIASSQEDLIIHKRTHGLIFIL